MWPSIMAAALCEHHGAGGVRLVMALCLHTYQLAIGMWRSNVFCRRLYAPLQHRHQRIVIAA